MSILLPVSDCSEVNPEGDGGFYLIQPEGSDSPFNVTCMFDNEGDWTVLQHRINGETDFYRVWNEYKNGFGRQGLDTNHW